MLLLFDQNMSHVFLGVKRTNVTSTDFHGKGRKIRGVECYGLLNLTSVDHVVEAFWPTTVNVDLADYTCNIWVVVIKFGQDTPFLILSRAFLTT